MSTTALATSDPLLARSHGAILRGKLSLNLARLELTGDRLRVYQHSRWLTMFGLLGMLIARRSRGTIAIDLALTQIAALGRGKFGRNKKVLDLTSTDGATHRLMVDDYDAFTGRLREQVARHARLVDAGAEQWQVQAA